jgi:hypothetical protein
VEQRQSSSAVHQRRFTKRRECRRHRHCGGNGPDAAAVSIRVLGMNRRAPTGRGWRGDQDGDVAVNGPSAAVYFGGRRRGEVVVSVASMHERKKTVVFPRLGPTGR